MCLTKHPRSLEHSGIRTFPPNPHRWRCFRTGCSRTRLCRWNSRQRRNPLCSCTCKSGWDWCKCLDWNSRWGNRGCNRFRDHSPGRVRSTGFWERARWWRRRVTTVRRFLFPQGTPKNQIVTFCFLEQQNIYDLVCHWHLTVSVIFDSYVKSKLDIYSLWKDQSFCFGQLCTATCRTGSR